jgi:hypothetical protein
MCQRLPLELVDAILEYLTDDKLVLAACCLVCKAWIYPSRRCLFADVEIRNQNTARHALLSSSTTWSISPYVRRLRLIGLLSLSFWNEKLPHLRSLKNLRSLTITSLHWHHTSPGAVLVCNNFKTIVRLHLGRIQFITLAQLAIPLHFLHSCKRLAPIRRSCGWIPM